MIFEPSKQQNNIWVDVSARKWKKNLHFFNRDVSLGMNTYKKDRTMLFLYFLKNFSLNQFVFSITVKQKPYTQIARPLEISSHVR